MKRLAIISETSLNPLASGKSDAAAAKAEELKTALNSLKSQGSKITLSKTTGLIASAKNLAAQRDALTKLANEMLTLAKAENEYKTNISTHLPDEKSILVK
ncbi:hypothetical protein WG906_12370 [Pedobacter sp. P351]|uniref:hypothetical protein n=1 Tax=Pedobacter superstes TaxID=3133441 RepID=UPI0030A5FE8C